MLLRIPGVLSPAELAKINGTLSNANFVDGKLTAGGFAKQVKNNTELQAAGNAIEVLNRIIRGSLDRNPVFQYAALPHITGMPIFARYTTGMFYGDHIDAPFMGGKVRYRSDVSITVFLSETDSYDGGELVINTPFGDQTVKLPAGDAVIYPSSSLHHVSEVTRGVRTVAVTWIQSLVKDPFQRQLLFELHESKEQLATETSEPEKIKKLSNVYVNILRMWSET